MTLERTGAVGHPGEAATPGAQRTGPDLGFELRSNAGWCLELRNQERRSAFPPGLIFENPLKTLDFATRSVFFSGFSKTHKKLLDFATRSVFFLSEFSKTRKKTLDCATAQCFSFLNFRKPIKNYGFCNFPGFSKTHKKLLDFATHSVIFCSKHQSVWSFTCSVSQTEVFRSSKHQSALFSRVPSPRLAPPVGGRGSRKHK